MDPDPEDPDPEETDRFTMDTPILRAAEDVATLVTLAIAGGGASFGGLKEEMLLWTPELLRSRSAWTT